MINKKIFEKTKIKYGLIGFGVGILIYVFGVFFYHINIVETFINILIYLPFKFYLKIYNILNLCPGCVDNAFGLALVTMPIYLGLLGFLIGYIIEKIKKK